MGFKYKNNWKSKSLSVLENKDWGDSSGAPTDLVKRCIDLRKVPLDEYNLSDLRVMIGQQIGLHYLIPIAIERLQPDLFIDVDFYEGDLLAAVLNVDSSFWKDHPDFWKQVYELSNDKKDKLKEFKISAEKFDSAKPGNGYAANIGFAI